MVDRPRRESKLDGDPFGPPDDTDVPEPPKPEQKPVTAKTVEQKPPRTTETPTKTTSTSRRSAERPSDKRQLPDPVTRNPRRLRVVGKVNDDDMVSFNCKMARGLRRQVRHFAADAECDIQDVVAAALAEYLTRRGIDVPASELQQPG